jgi:hypothetical protein
MRFISTCFSNHLLAVLPRFYLFRRAAVSKAFKFSRPEKLFFDLTRKVKRLLCCLSTGRSGSPSNTEIIHLWKIVPY